MPTVQGLPPIDSKTKINVLPLPKGQDHAYVTFGAGLSTQRLNNLLASSGLFTMGAAHGEVSVAGGWVSKLIHDRKAPLTMLKGQTAGHSPLAVRYGLGADQFVEFKIVTADGKLKVANSATNPDLFYALRGGGGGTWGVVVEATVVAYSSPAVSASMAFLNTTNFDDKKSIYKVAAKLHADFPGWTEKGVSIFMYLYPNAISIYAMNSGKEGTKAWHDQNWGPYLKTLAAMPGMSTGQYTSVAYPNFKSLFDAVWGPIGGMHMAVKRDVDLPVMDQVDHSSFRSFYKRHGPREGEATLAKGINPLDSWLLGKEHLKSPLLAQALEDAMPPLKDGQYRGQLIGGGKVLTSGHDNAVHPAWRRTYAHLVLIEYGGGYPDAGPLRELAPDMGAYANEASIHTPNWREAFWGPNYDKLSAIKKKYDPEHLFWVTPGIDADAWIWKNGRLCKNPDLLKSRIFNLTEQAPLNDNFNAVNLERDDETRGASFPRIRGANGTIVLNTGGKGAQLASSLKGVVKAPSKTKGKAGLG